MVGKSNVQDYFWPYFYPNFMCEIFLGIFEVVCNGKRMS